MPPKAKFTREEIISAALELVRKEGAAALTSRALGAALGSSARPIFTVFDSMEQVQQAVLAAADGIYQSYLQNAMSGGQYPPYKASGIGYIRFAREERELFKLLFMRDRSGEEVRENREAIRPILDILMKNLNISEDTAYLLHMESWVYVHGIATMLATSYLDWDMEFISRSLTDIYQGLIYRHKGGSL